MQSQHKWIFGLTLAFSLAQGITLFAQDPNPPSPPPNGGWRRFEQTTPAEAPPPYEQGPQQDPARRYQAPPRYQNQNPPPRPATFTVPAGTWLTIRVNEPISSDHSQAGDSFTASLAEPLVSNGFILARRGQMVAGVVSEAKKAGRVQGTSRLGLELTEMSLADGRQIQLKTRLMERRGDTSYGRDAAAIGTTVGAGAAIGAAVNGGVGAGVGAAAGVVASTIGVMLTRGRATEVYPEQPLTFRLEAPLTVDASDEAFQPVSQEDYDRQLSRRPQQPARYGAYPPPYYYGYGGYGPYYYGGLFSPYYGYGFGPNFYFSYGRGFRGGFRGRR
jgi:hypothetical protein